MLLIAYTVELGYNEFTAITTYICQIVWSQMFGLVHKASRL